MMVKISLSLDFCAFVVFFHNLIRNIKSYWLQKFILQFTGSLRKPLCHLLCDWPRFFFFKFPLQWEASIFFVIFWSLDFSCKHHSHWPIYLSAEQIRCHLTCTPNSGVQSPLYNGVSLPSKFLSFQTAIFVQVLTPLKLFFFIEVDKVFDLWIFLSEMTQWIWSFTFFL